jgi:hypothetical protein
MSAKQTTKPATAKAAAKKTTKATKPSAAPAKAKASKPAKGKHPSHGRTNTACDPVVLENQSIGFIMNAKVEGNKLKAEAWIEDKLANKVDARVLRAIANKQPMEVSTGLFTDEEDHAGEFNGKAYRAIARNHQPDHLAILPDERGACSLKDGAGLLVNGEHQQKPLGLPSMGFGKPTPALYFNASSQHDDEEDDTADDPEDQEVDDEEETDDTEEEDGSHEPPPPKKKKAKPATTKTTNQHHQTPLGSPRMTFTPHQKSTAKANATAVPVDNDSPRPLGLPPRMFTGPRR